MMDVDAAILRQVGAPLSLERLQLGDPRPEEVLVRLVACGICHTDLSVRDGVIAVPVPAVLGHEGAGIVESVGIGVKDLAPGDHVIMSFSHCGHCHSCAASLPAYCEQFGPLNFACARSDGGTGLLDGKGEKVGSHFFGQSAFSTKAVVPRSNLIKVDSGLPLHVLAPLGCGIQTGAGAVLNVLGGRPATSIAVFGAGAVGLSAVMAARVRGYETIIAVDRLGHRLDLALELGASHGVEARDGEDVTASIRAIVPSGVEHAIDTTGSTAVVASAIRSLARLGVVIMLGLYRPGEAIPVEARYILLNGLTIRGVVEGDSAPTKFIPQLIDLFRSGRFPIDRLVRTFDFADINAALEGAKNGEVVKPVLLFEPGP